jgi:hypothetical protein
MGIETLLHKAYNAEPRLEKMDLIKGGENNNHNTTAIKSFAESDDDKIAMYTIYLSSLKQRDITTQFTIIT